MPAVLGVVRAAVAKLPYNELCTNKLEQISYAAGYSMKTTDLKEDTMANAVLSVEGMSCGHCVKAIEDAVGVLPGVSAITVDLDAKTVAIEYDAAKGDLATVKEAIDDAGYEVIA